MTDSTEKRKQSYRIKTEKRTSYLKFTARLTEDEHEKLTAIAEAWKVNRVDVIRKLIDDYPLSQDGPWKGK